MGDERRVRAEQARSNQMTQRDLAFAGRRCSGQRGWCFSRVAWTAAIGGVEVPVGKRVRDCCRVDQLGGFGGQRLGELTPVCAGAQSVGVGELSLGPQNVEPSVAVEGVVGGPRRPGERAVDRTWRRTFKG